MSANRAPRASARSQPPRFSGPSGTAARPQRRGRACAAPRRPSATARARPGRRPAAPAAPDAPTRRHSAPSSAIISPPQAPPSVAEPEAVERDAEHRPAPAVLGGGSRDMRDVVLHARSAAARTPAPCGWRRNRDAGRRRRTAARRRACDCRWRIVSSRKRMVRRSSRSPRCGETNASRPRVMQTVFLRSRAMRDHAGAVARRDRPGPARSRARA